MARPGFLISVILKYLDGQDRRCPHCRAVATELVGRKYGLLQLRKCRACALMFRWPKDSAEDNRRFYSGLYRERSGVTTNLPSPAELRAMCASRFAGTDRDASGRIALLRSLKPAGALLDYGASWGYTAWQFAQAGYRVTGFEIDRDRAAYGRVCLGLEMIDDPGRFASLSDSSFDVIYSSHVLEHLPDLSATFDTFFRLLRPSGVLAVFVPNATGADWPDIFRFKRSFAFGEKHTFALSAEFFERNLPAHGFVLETVDTSPYAPVPMSRPAKDMVAGEELMAIGVKPG
jgi:2-polyprenyl-3-methyl-5-hydroxy-6-metoxy-1,4-benzoquinol methylase